MKNVYDAVQSFYSKDAAWEDIIKYNFIEGFLRQKAWQHIDDNELHNIWQELLMFGLYLAYTDIPLYKMASIKAEKMLSWLERNVTDFNMDYPTARSFFATVLGFQDYLAVRKLIEKSDELRNGAEKLIAGGVLDIEKVNEIEEEFFDDEFDFPLDAPSPIYLKLDEHLQELLSLLNKFYQKTKYIADFERAVFLYHGIMGWDEEDLENRKQEFWLGFWDYFLCDYHLIDNDKTPLEHFYDVGEYPEETACLLKELTNAKFTVFFVKNPSTQEWIECEDLFTGKSFYLPNPSENILELKDFLFMGHLFSQNMVLVNYVMSVPASNNLRRRIKEEVNKQIRFYRYQEPTATWGDFLKRHAVSVRHVIEIFTTFSKLNAVIDFEQSKKERVHFNALNHPVAEKIIEGMSKGLFSFHDQQLALRMWLDYCSFTDVRIRKPELWAAGLVANFADLNSAFEVDYNYIAENFDVSLKNVFDYKVKVSKVLELKEHDLRYLNEEGFIMLLMHQ